MILENSRTEIFCPTYATRKTMEMLKVKGSVFVVGRSGDGKTSLVHHILMELKKEKTNYLPYIIRKPEDFDHIPQRNSIVFVDNIFGSRHFSSLKFARWRDYFQCIEAYVHAGDMYFIATSPCHVRDECQSQLANIPVLNYVVDMTDEYCLGVNEKDDMLTLYLDSKGLQMSQDGKLKAVNSTLSLGFPLCCKLYVSNPKAQEQGAEFFEKPYLFLNAQISEFISSDKVAHMVLMLCVLKKGNFSAETFNPFSDSASSINIVKQICGQQENTTTGELRKKAEELRNMGYLKYNEQDGSFGFSHLSIYDAMCLSFGKEKGLEREFLELCPVDFLISNTGVSESGSDIKENIVEIHPPFRKYLIKRIMVELKNGEFKVFEHNIFTRKKLVNDIFENAEFATTWKEVLVNRESVFRLLTKKTLYVLTASKKYQSLVLKMVDTILNMSPSQCVEIPQEKYVITFDHVPIWRYASVGEIHSSLVHQCLEGSCIAGDLRVFQKVMKLESVKPCNTCYVKAVESTDDQAEILDRLLSRETVSYINWPLMIKNLIKMKKSTSLERVLDFVKKPFFQDERSAFELFSLACSSGNHDIFQLLQKTITVPNRQEKLLFEAVVGGNKKIIESLLTEKNKNCVDKHGRTLLHHACQKMPDLCDFLISKNVDHTIVDQKGLTALHLACQQVDKKLLENLIWRGFQVTVPIMSTKDNLRRLSPLHMAARNDKGYSLVDLLVQEGPKGVDMVNCQDHNGMTPLHIAAQRNYGQSMIKQLFQNKADHKLKDNKGKTALHRAAAVNIPQNIEFLLKHNAAVNEKDNADKTPLHYVLARKVSTRNEVDSQLRSVDHLLMKGADVSLTDKDGNSCVHIAAKFNTPFKIFEKVLMKADNIVNLNKDGLSPLHLIFQSNASLQSVTLLISKWPKLLQTNTMDGKSVLHVALERQSPYPILETVFAKDKSMAKTVSWNDCNFCEVLKQFNPEQIISFLVQFAGHFPSLVKIDIIHMLCKKTLSDELWVEAMDILKVDDFLLPENPEHQCLIFSVLDSPVKIRYLISKGASVNISAKNGNTPLHIAALQGCSEGVQTLLEEGADVEKVNMGHNTVLHLICKQLGLQSGQVSNFSEVNLMTLLREQVYMRWVQMFMSVDMFHYRLFSDSPDSYLNNAILTSLLNKNPQISVQNIHGFTPLHFVTHSKEVFNQLVSAGGDLKVTTDDGWSCLHSACLIRENAEVINHLLEKGLLACSKDSSGISPLHVALFCGMNDVETLKKLSKCSHEGHRCHSETQWPLLHVAALFSVKEMVEIFIELTPDALFKKDKEGHLPIHYAVASGDIKVLRIVADAMQATQHQGTMKTCSETDHVSKDEKYEGDQGSEGKCESSQNEREKQTPSSGSDHTGCHTPYTDQTEEQTLYQLLKSSKCKNEISLLHIAAKYSDPEVVKFLLREGFSVNERDHQGNTPLHFATADGSIAVVDCLLKEGAKHDCTNKKNLTPFLYGLSLQNTQPQNLIKLLQEYNVSVVTFSKEKSGPLHLLCRNFLLSFFLSQRHCQTMVFTDPLVSDFLKLLTMLIDKGCDVNARDKDGQTPLHMAAASNNILFVEILLDHEAEIDAVDNEGRTPLHRALESEFVIDFSAALCLIKRGANPHAVVRSGPIVLDILMKMNRPLQEDLEKIYKMLDLLDEKKEEMSKSGFHLPSLQFPPVELLKKMFMDEIRENFVVQLKCELE